MNTQPKFQWTDELVNEFSMVNHLQSIEHFKKSKEELPLQKEEIKVIEIDWYKSNKDVIIATFSKSISNEKFPEILKAIEQILNKYSSRG